MSKILVFGKNGQVGWELQRSLGLVGDVVFLGRNDQGGDLCDVSALTARIKAEKPEIIFNAAAYTAVDAAESDEKTAYLVNAEAVSAMAMATRELGALLVHYSTDYVFNGEGQKPWTESDRIAPINIYGLSKAAGESAVLESECKAYIFRTSWVYGVHGKNFMKTMIRLGKSREELGIVSDQIGAPTSAEFIADVSTWLALHHKIERPEIVNLVPSGATSWYEFACDIFANMKDHGLMVKKVKALSSAEYPTPAKRPLNSRLDNSKLISMMPPHSIKDWRHYSKRVLGEILAL